MKIFQIGFNKCGTKSLSDFFSNNGYLSVHWDNYKWDNHFSKNQKENKPLLDGTNPHVVFFSDIGFVPTMGGIHEGHISLINKSIKSHKKTIVSIFVNPKQFNSIKDFKSYPSSIKNDLTILKRIRKLDHRKRA